MTHRNDTERLEQDRRTIAMMKEMATTQLEDRLDDAILNLEEEVRELKRRREAIMQEQGKRRVERIRRFLDRLVKLTPTIHIDTLTRIATELSELYTREEIIEEREGEG